MKILICGSFLENSGYSHGVISIAEALDSVGATVALRDIPMGPKKGEMPENVSEWLKRDLNDVDVLLNYNLPSEWGYTDKCLNIGMYHYETNCHAFTGWGQNLTLQDKIIVSCRSDYDAVIDSFGPNFKDKTYIVRLPVNPNKIKEVEPLDFSVPKNCCKFFSIGESVKRKNFTALIAAYFSEFTSSDNVLLIIKTSHPSGNPNDAKAHIKNITDELKRCMRKCEKEMYPPIALVNQFLPEDQLAALYCTGDVFCSSSYWESACLPFQRALSMGKPCIVPGSSAFLDNQYDEDLLVNTNRSPVINNDNVPSNLYSSLEQWYAISVEDMSRKMRNIYENLDYYKSLKEERQNYAAEIFSPEKIGQELLEVIQC